MNTARNAPILKQRRRDLRRNQTEAEKAFWSHVRNRQFRGLRFFRQYSIGRYVLDFYCPKTNIAVELDGGQHAGDESREYDALRTEYLKVHKIEVVRFWNNDVLQNIKGVLARIEEKITSSNLPWFKKK
jgi:very-short-patch-repair endonuclease